MVTPNPTRPSAGAVRARGKRRRVVLAEVLHSHSISNFGGARGSFRMTLLHMWFLSTSGTRSHSLRAGRRMARLSGWFFTAHGTRVFNAPLVIDSSLFGSRTKLDRG